LEGNHRLNSSDANTPAVTNVNRAIALCKNFWKSTSIGRAKPQTQKVTPELGFIEIDERRAGVQDLVIVQELNISNYWTFISFWSKKKTKKNKHTFELHRKLDIVSAGQFVHEIQGLNLKRRSSGDFWEALRSVDEITSKNCAQLSLEVVKYGHLIVGKLSGRNPAFIC